jgi:hypothetical protein
MHGEVRTRTAPRMSTGYILVFLSQECLSLDERDGGRYEMMTIWRCSTPNLGTKNVTVT